MYARHKRGVMWRCFWLLGLLFVAVPISAVSTLTVTTVGNGIDVLTNLTGGNLDRSLAIITINSQMSQSPNGFRLEISSLKLGSFVRKPTPQTYANSALDGNAAPYTFTLVSNGNGVLGSAEPFLPIAYSLAMDLSLNFNTVVADTVGKEYRCLFTISPKNALLAGTFGDELTLTVSDL